MHLYQPNTHHQPINMNYMNNAYPNQFMQHNRNTNATSYHFNQNTGSFPQSSMNCSNAYPNQSMQPSNSSTNAFSYNISQNNQSNSNALESEIL